MLKLGILGFSDGNGHPYSWSAIFNGYDSSAMQSCGFPVICQYLAEQSWPDCRIQDAIVSHVWTPDSNLSRHIAASSLIPNVVSDPLDLIGHVDGILLARDDAESHFRLASPFLRAGLPIYIDKPIAYSKTNLNTIYDLRQYDWQIFTCSALRYSTELCPTSSQLQMCGDIKHVIATTPKSWHKYSIHVIEPLLNLLGLDFTCLHKHELPNHGRCVNLLFNQQITCDIYALGELTASPISITLYGSRSHLNLTFSDSFTPFRRSLSAFVNGVITQQCFSPFHYNANVVKIIEFGC